MARRKAHSAYEVTDLSFWREKLTAEQIQIEESVPIPNIERFEFRDLFGNRVELLQLLDGTY